MPQRDRFAEPFGVAPMNPHRKIRSSPTLSAGPNRSVQGGLTAAVLVLLPLLAVAGSDDLRAALDFTTGVLSLVSLTAAVAWGLIATDRLFLSSRQRLLGQGIHRATAASLGFLLLHVTVKVALGHVALLGALVPFGLGVRGTAGLIGFGSLAGLLMVVAAATGALRSAFATPGRIAGRWRALHALSYPAWCTALIHGLYAGRPPATWVVVMYSLCLVAVAAALCLRLLPPPTKRRITGLVAALIKPDTLPSEPDPALREAPLPGAERVLPLGREELGRERAYGGLGRDEVGRDELGRELRGTPLPSSFDRPRTPLSAPPPLYGAPTRLRTRLRPATPTVWPRAPTPDPSGAQDPPVRAPTSESPPPTVLSRGPPRTRSRSPGRAPSNRPAGGPPPHPHHRPGRRPRRSVPRTSPPRSTRTPRTEPTCRPARCPPSTKPHRCRGRSIRPLPENPGRHPQETDREPPPPRCARSPCRRSPSADHRVRPGGAARPRHASEGARTARTDDRRAPGRTGRNHLAAWPRRCGLPFREEAAGRRQGVHPARGTPRRRDQRQRGRTGLPQGHRPAEPRTAPDPGRRPAGGGGARCPHADRRRHP